MHDLILLAQEAYPTSPPRGSAVQALHDFGLPGMVLLILASGVLIYAFTRNARLAISATLAGAFMLLASGWVFQFARQPKTATVEVPQGHAEQVWKDEARPPQIAIPSAPTPRSDTLLKLTLATESPDVVIYSATGSRLSEAAAAIDQLVATAGPGIKFSATHAGDQRIYTRTSADQTLKSFSLTPRSVEVQFAKPPTAEQLKAIDQAMEPLIETWKLTLKSDWTGKGASRSQQLASQAGHDLGNADLTASDPATANAASEASDEQVWLASARASLRGASTGSAASRDWLRLADQPGRMVDGAYVKVASSGRFLTAEQCRSSLQAAIANEVRNYVGLRLGAEAEKRVDVAPAWSDAHVVKAGPWEEDVSSATVDGGGKRLHVLLVFDQRAQEDLKAIVREQQVHDRSLFAMLLLGGLVAVFGGVFGYLKTDTATKGFYSGRLKLALGTMLFLVATAVVWAVRRDLFW